MNQVTLNELHQIVALAYCSATTETRASANFFDAVKAEITAFCADRKELNLDEVLGIGYKYLREMINEVREDKKDPIRYAPSNQEADANEFEAQEDFADKSIASSYAPFATVSGKELQPPKTELPPMKKKRAAPEKDSKPKEEKKNARKRAAKKDDVLERLEALEKASKEKDKIIAELRKNGGKPFNYGIKRAGKRFENADAEALMNSLKTFTDEVIFFHGNDQGYFPSYKINGWTFKDSWGLKVTFHLDSIEEITTPFKALAGVMQWTYRVGEGMMQPSANQKGFTPEVTPAVSEEMAKYAKAHMEVRKAE